MKPLKISLIIDNLTEQKGGAERVVIDVANGLQDLGHKVTLVVYELSQERLPYHLNTQVSLLNVFPFAKNDERSFKAKSSASSRGSLAPRKRLVRRIKTLFKKSPNIWPLTELRWQLTHGVYHKRLRNHFLKDEPDVAIAFLPNSIVATHLASQGLKLNTIASIHNRPDMDFGKTSRWDQNPIFLEQKSRALESFDKITVLLPEFVNWFPEKLKSKVVVVPNGISIPETLSNYTERPKKIISVGRLSIVKSHDILIEAWAKIYSEFEGWELGIFGDGEEKERLENLVASLEIPKSRLQIHAATDEIFREMEQSRIMCHPAKYEGFGLVIAEALARGVPVIGFADCSGLNSLVIDGKTGLLVESNDDRNAKVDNLARAIRKLIIDEPLAQSMSDAAAASVQKFDKAIVMDIWDKYIQDIAKAPLI